MENYKKEQFEKSVKEIEALLNLEKGWVVEVGAFTVVLNGTRQECKLERATIPDVLTSSEKELVVNSGFWKNSKGEVIKPKAYKPREWAEAQIEALNTILGNFHLLKK